jgi:glutathione peroxidase-family protein
LAIAPGEDGIEFDIFTARNFTKFLIARDGTIVNRFEPAVEPESPDMTKAIEAELKKK